MTLNEWRALKVGDVVIDRHCRNGRRTIHGIKRRRASNSSLETVAMSVTNLKSPVARTVIFETENTGPLRFDLASDPRVAVNREPMVMIDHAVQHGGLERPLNGMSQQTCPECGEDTIAGFGLMGGGYGGYTMCSDDECGWFYKTCADGKPPILPEPEPWSPYP